MRDITINDILKMIFAHIKLIIIVSVVAALGAYIYADNFIPSAAAAIGCFAMAGGIAVTVISGSGAWLRLEQIRNLFSMTPHVFRIGKEGARRLNETQVLSDTASCVLNVFRRA